MFVHQPQLLYFTIRAMVSTVKNFTLEKIKVFENFLYLRGCNNG